MGQQEVVLIAPNIHTFVREKFGLPYYYVTRAISLGAVKKEDGEWKWNWHARPNTRLANKIMNEARAYEIFKKTNGKPPSGKAVTVKAMAESEMKTHASNQTMRSLSDRDILQELKRRGYRGTVKHAVVNEIEL